MSLSNWLLFALLIFMCIVEWIKNFQRIKDFQKSMDEIEEKVAVKGRASAEYHWVQYYELDDTYAWLQSLAKQYPQIVTLIEGGKTYQGRSILGVKISQSGTEKPGIFSEAGIHAREWNVFPHANPDGYVYNYTMDRMWRKTRTPYGSCFGDDPNRNWDFHWNAVGASNSACSVTYAGLFLFSEIELFSLFNYIASIKDKFQHYESFHAFSQYLLYPYGHTSDLTVNIKYFQQVFNASIAAIEAIYPTTDARIDWV